MQVEDDIELLIKSYQEGEPVAGKIIQRFRPLLSKYMDLLRGNVNVKDRPTVVFLSLFVADERARKELLKGHSSSPFAARVAKSIGKALDRCLRDYEDAEIYNELCVALLEMAMRYKYEGRSFLAYLSSSFHFWVYRQLSKLLQDFVYYCDVDGYPSPQTPESIIDISWVNESSLPPFSSLTRFERLLLYKRFVENKGLGQIALETGYNISSISKKISQIKAKIEAELKEEVSVYR
ncbi:MAG: hypothetical protein AB1330_01050 [Bacillota bacterium]